MDKKEIISGIAALFTTGKIDEAVAKLDEYVQSVKHAVETVSIKDHLKPYLNVKMLGIFNNPLGVESLPSFSNIFAGITVQRGFTSSVEEKMAGVLETEYRQFAEFLNKAADLDLIDKGLFFEPVKMRLAVVTPSIRTAIIIGLYSKERLEFLNGFSNFFIKEGQLPFLLEDVKWVDK